MPPPLYNYEFKTGQNNDAARNVDSELTLPDRTTRQRYATYVDGEIFVRQVEESLEAVIKAVKPRVSVDEEHSARRGGM